MRRHSHSSHIPHRSADSGRRTGRRARPLRRRNRTRREPHCTWVAGTPSAEIPFRSVGSPRDSRLPVVRFVGLYVLDQGNPIGRRIIPKTVTEAAP